MKIQKSLWKTGAGVSVVLAIFFSVQAASAQQWNPPTCDPDAVDPADPTCNVAAPLNTGSASQNKSGDLTVEGVFSATNGVILEDSSSSSVPAVEISHTASATVGVAITSASSDASLSISQSGAGAGILADTTAGTGNAIDAHANSGTGAFIDSVSGIGIFGGSDIGTAAQFETYNAASTAPTVVVTQLGAAAGVTIENTNSSANAYGLTVSTTNAAAIRGTISGTSSANAIEATADSGSGVEATSSSGIGVSGTSSSSTGVVGSSTSEYGIYGNSDASSFYYGGYFCNQDTNCAALGGAIYSASFDAKTYGPQYFGGQFYPLSYGSQNVVNHPKITEFDLSSVVDLGAANTPTDVLFDGSSIWILDQTASTVVRRSRSTMGIIQEYTLTGSITANFLLDLGTRVCAFGNDGKFVCIDKFNSASSVGASQLGTFGSGIHYTAGLAIGEYVYLGTSDNRVITYDFSQPLQTTIDTLSQPILDFEYANGYVFVIIDGDANVYGYQLYTTNALPTIALTSVEVPQALEFDGGHLWVGGSYFSGGPVPALDRIDIESSGLSTVVPQSEDITSVYVDGDDIIDLVFDGVYMWMLLVDTDAISGEVGKFSVAASSTDTDVVPLGASENPTGIFFDGTSMWVGVDDGNAAPRLQQYSTGTGFSSATPEVLNGFYMRGKDDTLYCVYIDAFSTLTYDTTLSNCQ